MERAARTWSEWSRESAALGSNASEGLTISHRPWRPSRPVLADGVISVDEAALVANVLQKFLDVLEILETAHRLGRGLSPVGDGSQ